MAEKGNNKKIWPTVQKICIIIIVIVEIITIIITIIIIIIVIFHRQAQAPCLYFCRSHRSLLPHYSPLLKLASLILWYEWFFLSYHTHALVWVIKLSPSPFSSSLSPSSSSACPISLSSSSSSSSSSSLQHHYCRPPYVYPGVSPKLHQHCLFNFACLIMLNNAMLILASKS